MVYSSKSYLERIWLDYKAGNEAQNKYFAAKVRVDSVQMNSIGKFCELKSGNSLEIGSKY